MNKTIFIKILLFVVITGLTSTSLLQAQHLFSVNYNYLSKENVTHLNAQIANLEIPSLSLTKNNDNKEVYLVGFSSVANTKIVILNEQTGAHVVVTPEEESLTEFQLAPFLIEELKQATLGETNRYLILETNLELLVKNAASISAAKSTVFIPRYFYGEKGNVKEAFPADRQIIHIFKEKPRLITMANDPERLYRIAQLEEAMSYYKYMFKLPNEVLCTYDEYHNSDNETNTSVINGKLSFILSGDLNLEQTAATEYALALWGEQLVGTVPVDINVLSVPMEPDVLGRAWQQQHFLNTTTNTYYHSPLWNQLVGYDATTLRDIRLEMNPNFSYHYQTNATPPNNKVDWVTVMLHEVCHGLGFSPIIREDGRYVYMAEAGGYATNHPGIYDRQLFQGTTENIRLTDLNQSGRAALITSDNLYAGVPGSNLLVANNGMRVKIYAPTTYQGGSSVSHWDNSATFPTFMKYAIYRGTATHTFNTRKIGILLDLGWKQNLGIVETLRTASLQVIPNPASQTIELRITNYAIDQVQKQTDQIEFYNIFGQLIKSVPFTEQTYSDGVTQKINVSELNTGVYMIRVGSETVKLVIN